MPVFFTDDTVRTKAGGIIGTVERTHLDLAPHTSDLSIYPIVCWTEVPEDVLLQFVASGGVPPPGYVFVVAADDAKGSFLAAVDDIELVSRSFGFGDSAKRCDGLLGTVVDAWDSYDLCPLFHADGQTVKHYSELAPEAPRCSIVDVPSRDVETAESLLQDDIVTYQNWVGIVRDMSTTAIVKLEDDALVAITNSSDLFTPISNADKRLLTPGDFHGLHGPLHTIRLGRHAAVAPIDNPKIGSLVVGSRITFQRGRWLRGRFNPVAPREGRVVATVPTLVMVEWLSFNPFARFPSRETGGPSQEMRMYENIHTFRRGDELRALPGFKVLDVSRPAELSVAELEGGSREKGLHSVLGVGDCVRFRDPASAAVSYQPEGSNDPAFRWIDPKLTGGWDLNVFAVTSRKQTVKVRWNDGSESVVSSSELSKFSSFDDDMRPCDIVVGRAGLKMKIPSSSSSAAAASDQTQDSSAPPAHTLVDFNEMKFFETTCDLKAQRVGVVQTIDAHDSVATVRWYKNPHVLLTQAGTVLSDDSHFGAIGDEIEECSMYEIMKFPALQRECRDLVIIPPPVLLQCSEAEQRAMMSAAIRRMIAQQPSLAYLALGSPVAAPSTARSGDRDDNDDAPLSDPTNVEWVGEVVALGLDGGVTVRLSGATTCRDVTVDFDMVVETVDMDHVLDGDDEGPFTEDSDSMVIDESIEYEGGERIDNDLNDANWESVDEEDGDRGTDADGDIDGDIDMADSPLTWDPATTTTTSNTTTTTPIVASKPDLVQADTGDKASFCRLLGHLPTERPPSFAILDTEPPADQHQSSGPPSSSAASSAFLKRMQQEHKMLSTSLPSTIFVRSYESNLRLLRCLIIGPADTPYENAPFLVDLALPPTYPLKAPTAHFHSWTGGLGRINPNLYEEGKICLSLLGTWPGRDSAESWSPSATLLQLLVSIQGLILVRQPFFNEAGLEEYAGQANTGYEAQSHQYNEKAYVMARRFVVQALTHPPGAVEDVVAWLYFRPTTAGGLLQDILARAHGILRASHAARAPGGAQAGGGDPPLLLDGAGRASPTEAFLRPLSRGAIVMLTRLVRELTDGLDETRQAQRQPTTTTTTTTDEHRALIQTALDSIKRPE